MILSFYYGVKNIPTFCNFPVDVVSERVMITKMSLRGSLFIAPKEVAGVEKIGIIIVGSVFYLCDGRPGAGAASHARGAAGDRRPAGHPQKDQEVQEEQENQEV
jgi:hypothetical protein